MSLYVTELAADACCYEQVYGRGCLMQALCCDLWRAAPIMECYDNDAAFVRDGVSGKMLPKDLAANARLLQEKMADEITFGIFLSALSDTAAAGRPRLRRTILELDPEELAPHLQRALDAFRAEFARAAALENDALAWAVLARLLRANLVVDIEKEGRKKVLRVPGATATLRVIALEDGQFQADPPREGEENDPNAEPLLPS